MTAQVPVPVPVPVRVRVRVRVRVPVLDWARESEDWELGAPCCRIPPGLAQPPPRRTEKALPQQRPVQEEKFSSKWSIDFMQQSTKPCAWPARSVSLSHNASSAALYGMINDDAGLPSDHPSSFLSSPTRAWDGFEAQFRTLAAWSGMAFSESQVGMDIIQDKLQGMERTLKVLIVDDHPLVVDGLRSVLHHAVIEQAGSIKACMARLQAGGDHDLVILDFFLSDGDASLALRQIRQVAPSLPILVFSSTRDRARLEECLTQGASGYLSKQADAARLVASVHAVLRGDCVAWMSHEEPAEDALLAPVEASMMKVLSERERKIFSLLARGLSNRKIAEDCFISENTVKTHVSNILHKLNVGSRSEAAYLFNCGSTHP